MGKRVNKTLHSVLARWISTEDRELGHNNDNKEEEGDEENENEGYNSDIGYDLLSKRWSRERRQKCRINMTIIITRELIMMK